MVIGMDAAFRLLYKYRVDHHRTRIVVTTQGTGYRYTEMRLYYMCLPPTDWQYLALLYTIISRQ